MKRALMLLLIFGMIILGCAEKIPIVEKPIETPTEQAPTPTETPTVPAEDINETLTDVDELLKDLQEIENISFNL